MSSAFLLIYSNVFWDATFSLDVHSVGSRIISVCCLFDLTLISSVHYVLCVFVNFIFVNALCQDFVHRLR